MAGGVFWDSSVRDGNIGGSAAASTTQNAITSQGHRTTTPPSLWHVPLSGLSALPCRRCNNCAALLILHVLTYFAIERVGRVVPALDVTGDASVRPVYVVCRTGRV